MFFFFFKFLKSHFIHLYRSFKKKMRVQNFNNNNNKKKKKKKKIQVKYIIKKKDFVLNFERHPHSKLNLTT